MKKLSSLLTGFILLAYLSINAQEINHFEYYQRLIFIHLKLNNTDSLLFLLDTGANGSAIDSKTAERLKLKEYKVDRVEGSAGTISVPSVKLNKVSMGRNSVKNLSFTKYDLSGSLSLPGKHLDGILGTDFLKHFVVNIDFKNKLIILRKNYRGKKETGIPFEMDNGIPRINVSLNNSVETYLRYDSGASLFETDDVYLNVTTKVFKVIFESDKSLKPVSYLSGTGIGGNIDLPVYKLKSLNLGPIAIKTPFIIVQPEQGYFARPDAVGFLSNNLMEKFNNIILDFIKKKLYINAQSL